MDASHRDGVAPICRSRTVWIWTTTRRANGVGSREPVRQPFAGQDLRHDY